MDLNALMKQAQAMQQKLQDAQGQFAQTVVEGASGGGLVAVTLDGTGAMRGVRLDDGLLKSEEAEIISDLIVAAHADAKRKLDEAQAKVMQDVAGPLAGGFGGMPGFPGLKA
jgi:hypothetical protein